MTAKSRFPRVQTEQKGGLRGRAREAVRGPLAPTLPALGPPAVSHMFPGGLELLLQAEGPRWRRVTIPKGSPACLIVS